MEPTDLNPKSSDDEQIDSWLRASSAVPPLPDDGFSARVLAALPPVIVGFVLQKSLISGLAAGGTKG